MPNVTFMIGFMFGGVYVVLLWAVCTSSMRVSRAAHEHEVAIRHDAEQRARQEEYEHMMGVPAQPENVGL